MTRARYVRDLASWEQGALPGTFRIVQVTRSGLQRLDFYCPCGCGAHGSLLVAERRHPDAAFVWNGSTREPSLDRPVTFVGHWTGRLSFGSWIPSSL